MKNKFLVALIVALVLVLVPAFVSAQDSLTVSVNTDPDCDSAEFSISIEGGTAPYTILFDFGDEESYQDSYGSADLILDHDYPYQGDYAWSLTVEDADGMLGEAAGIAILSGPEVALTSTPFPPLLTLQGGVAGASFSAAASGGATPYTYEWDLDGDGLPDDGLDGDSAKYAYTAGGEYQAEVRVTDNCGFVETDSLTVVVVDPEEDSEEACHPTAQKIAEAVSSIFPDQAEQTYTCKDIFDIFEGALTGYQLGFGRMWHAYQLSQTIEELTWEEILDWQLNTGGWGLLAQLDRYADLLEEYSIVELVAYVASEEYSMNDVRSAVRAATRYEADFEDALARVSEGASPGELGQFYKLAHQLEEDPAALDVYLADGYSIADLRHSAKFAERMGVEWTEIAEAHSSAGSWGAVNQAYRLADEENSVEDILDMGVKEFRAAEREEERTQREQARNDETAFKLAEQFGVDMETVMSHFNGDCAGNWGCVRKALREQEQTQAQGSSSNNRESRTAQQLADKYGVSENEVMDVYDSCGGDWACTRAHFRDQNRPGRGKKNK